jgi:hypothetical protein
LPQLDFVLEYFGTGSITAEQTPLK